MRIRLGCTSLTVTRKIFLVICTDFFATIWIVAVIYRVMLSISMLFGFSNQLRLLLISGVLLNVEFIVQQVFLSLITFFFFRWCSLGGLLLLSFYYNRATLFELDTTMLLPLLGSIIVYFRFCEPINIFIFTICYGELHILHVSWSYDVIVELYSFFFISVFGANFCITFRWYLLLSSNFTYLTQ